MKFLVLALCVCAANAASFGAGFNPLNSGYRPRFEVPSPAQFAKAVASTGPTVFVAKTVPSVSSPVNYIANAEAQTASVAPVVYPAAKAVAQAVATPFQQAAKTVVGPVVDANNYAKNVLYKDEAESQAPIVRFETNVEPEAFNYNYETKNGISANANGFLKKVGESNGLAVEGSYAYTAPDGTPVLVTYIADENGYQPKSNVLPVGPETPEAILRSLAYIASQKPYVEKDQKY